MFCIEIADVTVQLDNRFDCTKDFYQEYLTDEDAVAQMEVSVTDEEIEEVRKENDFFSFSECESLALGKKMCLQMIDFDAFILHAAVIETEGKAYAFLGKSGAGKSTHMMLWKKMLGDNARIINGDKPIIRKIDGRLCVCGTPFRGKEGFGEPCIVPLAAICFIEQAKDNAIHLLDSSQILERIMHQLFAFYDMSEMTRFLNLVDEMICTIPGYRLECTISEQAAKISYNAMVVNQ